MRPTLAAALLLGWAAFSQAQPLYVTMGGRVYRDDAPTAFDFRPFPDHAGPVATACSPDGKWFYSSARRGNPVRLTVRKDRVLPNGDIDTSGAAAYWEFLPPTPGYRGSDVLTYNDRGLFIADAPGWGTGGAARLDPDTLRELKRFEGGPATGVSFASPRAAGDPTIVGDTRQPFVMLDIRVRRLSAADRDWVVTNYERVFREAFGLPLCVSDGRPPGRWRLQPGYYPVVVVYDPADWPWPDSGGHTRVSWGKATPGADVAIPVVGQASRELTLFSCVHESCHGLGLSDKYVGAPPGAYPGHVMGATRVPWPPQRPLADNFVREPHESATMKSRHGSMIGRGGAGR